MSMLLLMFTSLWMRDENSTALGVASNGGMMTDGIVDKFEEQAEEGQVLYDTTEDRCCCCCYGSR